MARSLVQRVIRAVGMSVAKTGDGRAGRRTPYRIAEFVQALEEAGCPLSESTVRRMFDAKQIAGYRTRGETGERRIYARELARLIAEQRKT